MPKRSGEGLSSFYLLKIKRFLRISDLGILGPLVNQELLLELIFSKQFRIDLTKLSFQWTHYCFSYSWRFLPRLCCGTKSFFAGRTLCWTTAAWTPSTTSGTTATVWSHTRTSPWPSHGISFQMPEICQGKQNLIFLHTFFKIRQTLKIFFSEEIRVLKWK